MNDHFYFLNIMVLHKLIRSVHLRMSGHMDISYLSFESVFGLVCEDHYYNSFEWIGTRNIIHKHQHPKKSTKKSNYYFFFPI